MRATTQRRFKGRALRHIDHDTLQLSPLSEQRCFPPAGYNQLKLEFVLDVLLSARALP